MKVKEESEKVGLNLNIQKTKIMASGPITSWEIDGETVETVSDFIFLPFVVLTEHIMGFPFLLAEHISYILFWGAPKSLQIVITAIKLKDAYSLEGKL